MAISTPQKWLIGCGIGCAAMILLVVGLVTSAILFVRGRFQPLQEASDSRKEIVAAYGAPDAFVPPWNGAIAPARLEVFLSVRDSLKDAQVRLDAALANFDFDRLNQKQQSFGTVLRMLNDLSNLIVPIGEYVNRRNRILMDKHMGLGEYAYIYSIAYYSWLDHRPDEVPPILERARQRGTGQWSVNDPGLSPEGVRRQYRRVILRLLSNQLDSIKDPEQTKWRGTLKEEIDRIGSNPDRVAWQDVLPLPIEQCLKPYRDRMAATYYSTTNYFEFLTLEEFNQVQWSGQAGGGIGRGRRTDAVPAEAPEVGLRGSSTTGIDAAKGVGNVDVTYEVGAGVTAPVPMVQPLPAYTDQAKKARIEGIVSIQAVVRKDGSVDSLKVIRSLGYGLDEAAMHTIAAQWRFKPGALNGLPVDVQARIDLRFRLHY